MTTPGDTNEIRTFALNRLVDHSGISGVGIVAAGATFPDGIAMLRWLGEYKSVAMYKDMDTLTAVHCHGGDSTIEWARPDAEPGRIERDVVLLIAVHAAIRAGGLIDTELSWL